MQCGQQYMESRAAKLLAQGLHPFVQHCGESLYQRPAGGLVGDAGAIARAQQRFRHTVVTGQPVVAVALVTGGLVVTAIVLDEVAEGWRLGRRLLTLQQGAVDLAQGLGQLGEAPAIEDQVMGFDLHQVMLGAQAKQRETAQPLAFEGERLLHLPLDLHPGGGQRIGRIGQVVEHQLHRPMAVEILQRQAILAALAGQHGAQHVVPGHHQFHGALHQLGTERAAQLGITADVVQGRVAAAELVEPDIPLPGGQRQARGL